MNLNWIRRENQTLRYTWHDISEQKTQPKQSKYKYNHWGKSYRDCVIHQTISGSQVVLSHYSYKLEMKL